MPEPNLEEQVPKLTEQQKYVNEKVAVLLDQIGDEYGESLTQQLVQRLDTTVADFHEEVNEMLGRLKDNSEKRHEKLKEIWNNPDVVIGDVPQGDGDQEDGPGLNTEEMSEWEKKIEAGTKEKPAEEQPKEEEVKKKKGFFGRKKK